MLKKSNKPSKKSDNKHKITNKQILLLGLGVTVVLLTLIIVAGGFLTYMWRVQQAEGGTTVKTLILLAIDGLSDPAPIDAQTGKVYIPQEKLVFPATDSTYSADIRYRYSPATETFPEELGVVNTYGVQSARTQIISQPTLEAFEAVPQIQACTRGYTFSFTELNDRGKPTFTKILKDGRKIWVYLDEGCTQTIEDFETYLKQVDSY